ncbi:hypothetical protein MMC11_004494 [Xylographa trunciseda]|nr:hypothetical protein [Xylographa trunciseda]
MTYSTEQINKFGMLDWILQLVHAAYDLEPLRKHKNESAPLQPSTEDARIFKELQLQARFTQSGPRFHDKTRALEKALIKAFPSSTLHYPTGPLPLRPADIPGFVPSSQEDGDEKETDSFAWWRRQNGDSPLYTGMDRGLEKIAESIRREGPFDGVIGFSQGGAAAAIVASLLEPGRREAFETAYNKDHQKFKYPPSFVKDDGKAIQLPLKFAIVYSGFAAPMELYSAFYEPKITTPVLHFLGSLDTLVDEKRGRVLIDSCKNGSQNVVTHPGGHFLPSQKIWLDAAIGFVKECIKGTVTNKATEEDNVEDMDVPF